MMTAHKQDLEIMPEGMITKALEAVRDRVARAERERAELDRLIASAREEERLLLRLLALRQGAVGETEDAGQQELTTDGSRIQGQVLQATDKVDQPLIQVVLQELGAAGRPLHISELMRLLRTHGVQIPGAGTQANLITHLRRDQRLVRPSRGMYGLAAWGLENMPTPEHKKRRKKRIYSKASTGKAKA